MRDASSGRDLPDRRGPITWYYLLVVKVLHSFRTYHARNERYASMIHDLVGPFLRRARFVIDLGCGPDGITTLLPVTDRIIGVDVDRYYLLRFPESGVSRVQARAECLPFKEGSVDVIVALSLIEHIVDQVALFQGLARVLHAQGVVVVQVPDLNFPIEPHTKWPFLLAWKRGLQGRILVATGYTDLNLSTTISHICRCARSAGFKIDRVLPIWHFRLAQIAGRPMGYFIILNHGA